MTTLNEARQEIFSQFVIAWADRTPYALQNENLDTANLNEWCRVTVLNNLSTQDTLGPKGKRRFERGGTATVQIFVEGGKGTDRLDELSTIAKNAFEGFTFDPSSVTFRDVVVNEIGPDGKWYQYNVVADFRYYETK